MPVRAKAQRGAAVVEMAVVAPILLSLMFGIIEFSWYMSAQQTVTNATREGCRVAVIKGTSDQDVINRINEYLAPAGLTNCTISLRRATVDDPTETVVVSLPYSQISLLGDMGSMFPGLCDKTITATCSMRKEGT